MRKIRRFLTGEVSKSSGTEDPFGFLESVRGTAGTPVLAWRGHGLAFHGLAWQLLPACHTPSPYLLVEAEAEEARAVLASRLVHGEPIAGDPGGRRRSVLVEPCSNFPGS